MQLPDLEVIDEGAVPRHHSCGCGAGQHVTSCIYDITEMMYYAYEYDITIH